MKSISSNEILATFFSAPFSGNRKSSKNYFPKSFKTYKLIKKSLKTIDETAEFLTFPFNELVSLVSQKESWTKEELNKLDEQLSSFVKKYLIKSFAQNF